MKRTPVLLPLGKLANQEGGERSQVPVTFLTKELTPGGGKQDDQIEE